MGKYDKYLNGVSIYNCNARLTRLYEIRLDIERKIDSSIYNPDLVKMYEDEYDQVRHVITDLCIYRRHHKDCLIEGDPGYTLW